jgi:hypothetical protein
MDSTYIYSTLRLCLRTIYSYDESGKLDVLPVKSHDFNPFLEMCTTGLTHDVLLCRRPQRRNHFFCILKIGLEHKGRLRLLFGPIIHSSRTIRGISSSELLEGIQANFFKFFLSRWCSVTAI